MARKPANAEPDFETTLVQLETIVTKLESGELPLAQLGQERLQQAEQRIQILLQKSETAPLSDYQGDE